MTLALGPEDLAELQQRVRDSYPDFVRDLQRLVDIDSGTFTKSGVDRVSGWMVGRLETLGASVTRHPHPDLGDTLVATFERSLFSGGSPYDRYTRLGDESALSEAAVRGLDLFTGKARCSHCHAPPLFTDGRFHNTGVSWGKQRWSPQGSRTLDLGRYEQTGREEDRGRFKVPSLRDVSRTAPYMHDGSMERLEVVIAFYSRGGGANPNLDQTILPLNLTSREKAELAAFLEALQRVSHRPLSHLEGVSEPHGTPLAAQAYQVIQYDKLGHPEAIGQATLQPIAGQLLDDSNFGEQPKCKRVLGRFHYQLLFTLVSSGQRGVGSVSSV